MSYVTAATVMLPGWTPPMRRFVPAGVAGSNILPAGSFQTVRLSCHLAHVGSPNGGGLAAAASGGGVVVVAEPDPRGEAIAGQGADVPKIAVVVSGSGFAVLPSA